MPTFFLFWQGNKVMAAGMLCRQCMSWAALVADATAGHRKGSITSQDGVLVLADAQVLSSVAASL